MSNPEKLIPVTVAEAFGWEFEHGKPGYIHGNVKAYIPSLQCTRCKTTGKEFCEYSVAQAGTVGSNWGLPPTDKLRTRGRCVQCKSEVTRASGCSIMKDGWVVREPGGVRFVPPGRLGDLPGDAPSPLGASSVQANGVELGEDAGDTSTPASKRLAAAETLAAKKRPRVPSLSAVWPGKRCVMPPAKGTTTGQPQATSASPINAANKARAVPSHLGPLRTSTSAAVPDADPASSTADSITPPPPSSPRTVSSTSSVIPETSPAVSAPSKDSRQSPELALLQAWMTPGHSMSAAMTRLIAFGTALESASQNEHRQTLASEIALDTLKKEREARRHVEAQLREDNRAAEKRAETAAKDAAAAREEAKEARASAQKWKEMFERA